MAPENPSGGDVAGRQALDHLFSVAYEELHRLASSIRRGTPGAVLSPTTLVNEAWLRLAGSPHCADASRLHLKRICACAMRQLLVEAARRQGAQKRGGGAWLVTFDESLHLPAQGDEELLALDAAMTRLASLHPRQAVLVESRFFGGLEVAEVATLLQVSEATVMRDWRAARAWLAVQLRRAG